MVHRSTPIRSGHRRGGWRVPVLPVSVRRGAAASALQPAAGRRQVVIAGRRVRTIDMHSHVFVGDVLPLMKDRKEADPGLANLGPKPDGGGRRHDRQAPDGDGSPGNRPPRPQRAPRSVLLLGRCRSLGADHQDTEREDRRNLRRPSRPLRRAGRGVDPASESGRRGDGLRGRRSWVCAASSSAETSTAMNWPIPGSIRSGRKRRSWESSSSCTRPSPISAASDWPARARSPTRSGFRWTPPSRWPT